MYHCADLDEAGGGNEIRRPPLAAVNTWQRFQMLSPTYDADRICRVSMASALGLGTSGGRCGCIL